MLIKSSETHTGVWYLDTLTGMYIQIPHPRKLTDEEKLKMFDPVENAKMALKMWRTKPYVD